MPPRNIPTPSRELNGNQVLRFFVQSPDRSVHDTVVNTVENLIRQGFLRKGDALPGAELLADHLGVAHLTVERSYKYLKGLGILKSTPRVGTVIDNTSAVAEVVGRRVISGAILACRQLGMTRDQIMALFESSLAGHFKSRPRKAAVESKGKGRGARTKRRRR